MITVKDFEKAIAESKETVWYKGRNFQEVNEKTAAAACFELAKKMAKDFADYQGRYYADIYKPVKTTEELFNEWQSSQNETVRNKQGE